MGYKIFLAILISWNTYAEKFREIPFSTLVNGYPQNFLYIVQDQNRTWYALSGSNLYSSKDLLKWNHVGQRFDRLYQSSLGKPIYATRSTSAPIGTFQLKDGEWKKIVGSPFFAGVDQRGIPFTTLGGDLFIQKSQKERTWQQVSISGDIKKAVELKDGTLIIAGTTGVYKMEKGEEPRLLAGSPPDAVGLTSDGEKAIAVSTFTGRIFASADLGKTWKELSLKPYEPRANIETQSFNLVAVVVSTTGYNSSHSHFIVRFKKGTPFLFKLNFRFNLLSHLSDDGKITVIDSPSQKLYEEVLPTTVKFTLEGEGKILVKSSNGDILRIQRNCLSTRDFSSGDLLELKAVPAEGYVFEKWVGCPSKTAVCERFQLKQSENAITAVFRKKD